MDKKKGRVVTKEELEKSGYTNLRDFLNAERGLKRRDGKAPERTEAYKATERMRRDRASNMRAQARKADVEMETPEERASMNLAGYKRDKEDMSGSGEYSPFKKGGRVNENKMLKRKGRNMTRATMQKEAKKAVRKHEKSMHGMNMGGSVSKRADGIAQRGKTKCKMV